MGRTTRSSSFLFSGLPLTALAYSRKYSTPLHHFKTLHLCKGFKSARRVNQVRLERKTFWYCSYGALETISGESSQVRLSVVVPFYNEVDSIEYLVEAVKAACEDSPFANHWELICVDDGSTDGTTDKLKRLCEKHSQLRGVSLRKNFGQTAALSAGFDIASGDIIATLDGDLQNDPKDIFRLIETMKTGDYDLVSGWRRSREDAFLRSKFSQAANWLIRRITGVPIHDLGCSTKVYKREIIRDIQLYGEMHRFIVVLAMYEGARIGEKEVSHYPRKFGKSKYGLDRTIRVICDLTFLYYLKKFRTRPSHLFGSMAIFFAIFPLCLMATVLTCRVFGRILWSTGLLVWVLLHVTFQLVSVTVLLGIMLEVMTRTYYESQNKRIYRVRKYFPEKPQIGFQ
ncbi:hypothetical protein GAYE_SCF09G3238 [Galdieria yellowstonensis]|uniref:Glycosyltransferase 2-like domain-containing protein n=1 Tax=Galdieria yellowstonensis TaxID=3028027 RepID=A0AAV9ICY1_9RHOD|nr:hypothetical protein GAYE_SCF09G3238 [Galdieria yellowstonensis]